MKVNREVVSTLIIVGTVAAAILVAVALGVALGTWLGRKSSWRPG